MPLVEDQNRLAEFDKQTKGLRDGGDDQKPIKNENPSGAMVSESSDKQNQAPI